MFGSNRQGAEIINQFLSFSAHQAMPLISQNCLPLESPTPAAHIIVLPDNYNSLKSKGHLFSHPAAFDSSMKGLRFPRDGPPGPPSDNDDPDFPNNDLLKQSKWPQRRLGLLGNQSWKENAPKALAIGCGDVLTSWGGEKPRELNWSSLARTCVLIYYYICLYMFVSDLPMTILEYSGS